MQQSFYDLITRESEKIVSLRDMYTVDVEKKRKDERLQRLQDENHVAAENEKKERIRFEEEMKKEALEKKMLLQDIINEANESGYPLPPSLIKLLHGNNGI